MFKMSFKYLKDGVVSQRVVISDGKIAKSKEGKSYFRGENVLVDGKAPQHPFSTYLGDNVVEGSMNIEKV